MSHRMEDAPSGLARRWSLAAGPDSGVVDQPAQHEVFHFPSFPSLCNDDRWLKDWFQSDHRKNQSDESEHRLRVKVKAHV